MRLDESRLTQNLSLVLAALLSLVVLSSGCGWRNRRVSSQPSILLITIDTLRADHCSTYGYSKPTTPRLDALAKQGVLCEVTYAPTPTTAPSHATMFTALLPREHGILKNGFVLADSHQTLAEIVRERGYRTAAFVSSLMLHRTTGFDQGFDHYDDDFKGAQGSYPKDDYLNNGTIQPPDRRANETRVRVLDWFMEQGYLSGDSSGKPPFFVWVHLFDPHMPYDPPAASRDVLRTGGPPNDGDPQVASYDAEVHFADSQVGVLLDRLERAQLLDNTITIVTSDHGEGLMHHDEMFHGRTLFEEAVRVPLVFRWPKGLEGGRRVQGPTLLADLTPTVLDLAGITVSPRKRHGQSIAGALRGQRKIDTERTVILQRRFFESDHDVDGVRVKGLGFAIVEGRWKYIEVRDEAVRMLFDLKTDPQERHNLFLDASRPSRGLARRLATWLDETEPGHAGRQSMSDENAERLRALGYVQ
jgi:choline-sulfatase